MNPLIDRGPARRWLLAILVGLLPLGHVCDLSAFARLDPHHAADHHDDEQISSCDTMPATSAPGHGQVGTPLDLRPVIDMAPARPAARLVEEPATLVDRPPLFLLHASLLI